MTLLCAHAESVEKNLSESRREERDLRERFRIAEKETAEALKRVAVLEQQIDSEIPFKKLQSMMLTGGGILVGIGGQEYVEKGGSWAALAAVAGVVLIVMAYVSSGKRRSK